MARTFLKNLKEQSRDFDPDYADHASGDPLAEDGDATRRGPKARGARRTTKRRAPDNVSAPPVAPLPIDVLPKPLQRFVREVATAIGCPTDYVVGFMLAMAGAALGTSTMVQIKPGWVESALLWLVVIGPSGDGKTPALSLVSRPLYDMQGDAMRQFKKKFAEWEADKVKEKGPAPRLARHFLDDTTVEAIALELRDNPKGFPLINDELSAWVRGMGRYKQTGGGAERSFWMKGWAMQPWSVTRVGHRGSPPLILSKPFVPVLGGIQPDLLSELVDGRGREDGFLARVLPVFPPSLPVPGAIDAFVSDEARESWQRCVRRLRKLL